MSRAAPGRAGYWIGAFLIVAGVVVAAVSLAGAVVGFEDRVGGFQRVAVPGERDVELDEGGHTVYFEVVGLGDDRPVPVPPLQVRLTGPGGAEVPIGTYGSELTYSVGGRSGVAVATADVPADGTYHLAVQAGGEPGGVPSEVAIGRGIGGTLVGGVVVALVCFFAGLVAGVATIAVTAVRRSRARRRSAPSWPPPTGPGWAPPPGGAGWPPPAWAPPGGAGWPPPGQGGGGWPPPGGPPPGGAGWPPSGGPPPAGWPPSAGPPPSGPGQPPPASGGPGPPPPGQGGAGWPPPGGPPPQR